MSFTFQLITVATITSTYVVMRWQPVGAAALMFESHTMDSRKRKSMSLPAQSAVNGTDSGLVVSHPGPNSGAARIPVAGAAASATVSVGACPFAMTSATTAGDRPSMRAMDGVNKVAPSTSAEALACIEGLLSPDSSRDVSRDSDAELTLHVPDSNPGAAVGNHQKRRLSTQAPASDGHRHSVGFVPVAIDDNGIHDCDDARYVKLRQSPQARGASASRRYRRPSRVVPLETAALVLQKSLKTECDPPPRHTHRSADGSSAGTCGCRSSECVRRHGVGMGVGVNNQAMVLQLPLHIAARCVRYRG